MRKAAHVFHTSGTPEAEQWVECRLLALLQGRSGGEIAKSLRAMIKTHALDADDTETVEKTAQYLVNNTRLLHYDRALAGGLPIAACSRSMPHWITARVAAASSADRTRGSTPRRPVR